MVPGVDIPDKVILQNCQSVVSYSGRSVREEQLFLARFFSFCYTGKVEFFSLLSQSQTVCKSECTLTSLEILGSGATVLLESACCEVLTPSFVRVQFQRGYRTVKEKETLDFL